MKKPTTYLLFLLPVIVFTACTHPATSTVSLLSYIDTRVGTAASVTKTAGMFGKHTEEYGQTIPAVLEPNGMNFWTPQTQDTELKCIAPYYYRDSLFQGFRNSHWISGGCTQDYGSMTLMPLAGKLSCTPEKRATLFTHDSEEATPAYYSVYLPHDESMDTTPYTAFIRDGENQQDIADILSSNIKRASAISVCSGMTVYILNKPTYG